LTCLFYKLSFIFILILWSSTLALSHDTTQLKLVSGRAGVNLILNNQSDDGGIRSFGMISSECRYHRFRQNSQFESRFDVESVTGFTLYNDSIWKKHLDRHRLHWLRKSHPGRIGHTLSGNFTTILFNEYEYTNASPVRKSGAPFSPATLEFGYGGGWMFKELVMVNLSLTTARFSMYLAENGMVSNERIHIATLENRSVVFDFGLLLTFTLRKSIGSRVNIECSGRLFADAFQTGKTEWELIVRSSLSLTRHVVIKMESNLSRNSNITGRIHYRNELTTGFYLTYPRPVKSAH
jgi:hypothetical protein